MEHIPGDSNSLKILEKVNRMEMMEVQIRAKKLGIKTKNFKKAELIRKIQAKEGGRPCFQMKGSICDKEDCHWRKDCLLKVQGKVFYLAIARNIPTL
jgi:hypothetical protein